MADAHRAEAVREVSESVLGQAEAEVRQLWGSSEPKRGWSRPEVPMRGMRVQAESTEVSGGFREAFEAVLGHTPRWEGFSLIVGDQLERERVGIIETGTCRKPGDWAGDGQSTRVWDWVLSRKPGVAVSVDVEMASVETAQKCCTRVHCVCQDSVTFLRGYIPFVPTLLYLDSRDWGPGAEVASCMQQVAELAACWERLPVGCLIASDDSHNLQQGKPWYGGSRD